MSKIARTTVVAALTVATLPAVARADAQAMKPWMPPGTAPPWGTTATTTESIPAAAPAAVPAAQSPRIESGAVMPAQAAATSIQATVTPIQGTTTPIHAVSLRAGPNTGASVIGTLQPGTPLRVLATANHGWMQVESPIGSGWAFGSYLAPTGSLDGIPHQAPPQEIISR